ncbi:aspartyl-phosphate phosphatase Spo0E family protein [Robertmurraya massiliosenegalensis]|uniref:aspartyl-phosphate phosphatase Spo0E family protein n=1 Tax=Robertmurraya TaxID=2837507 RepID=UPI0039A67F53
MLDEIQKKREKMIETAKRKGFTSDDTIRHSQELDQLIFEYQCQSSNVRKKEDELKVNFRQVMLILPQVHARLKIQSL